MIWSWMVAGQVQSQEGGARRRQLTPGSIATRLGQQGQRRWRQLVRILAVTLVLFSLQMPVAIAGLTDDHYDGNIFALYAGNGSLFPARISLPEARQRQNPAILVFFVDDSRDCKQFSPVVSQVDAFYGRAANIIPVNVDAIPPQSSYSPTEVGHYYRGQVPQTVILDQSGTIVFDEVGNVAFERMDDVLRQVFDLLPRNESIELKRRPVNELNTELVPQAS